MKKNTTGTLIELADAGEGDATIRYERRLWNEFALFLIFPRQVPDWIPDETIGNALRNLARGGMPGDIDDDSLMWKDLRHGSTRPATI